MKSFIVMFAAAVTLIGTGAPMEASVRIEADRSAAVGETAPPFTLQTQYGRFSLAETKTPVLLGIFATWCPHCQREVAVMNEVHRVYGDRLTVIWVNGSDKGADHVSTATADDVAAFGTRFGAEYPLAFDSEYTVNAHYFQRVVPRFILIDRRKIVRSVHSGEIPIGVLTKLVDDELFSEPRA